LVQEGSDFWLLVTRDYVSGGSITVPPYQAKRAQEVPGVVVRRECVTQRWDTFDFAPLVRDSRRAYCANFLLYPAQVILRVV
jgi:hypothetical protein